MDVIALGPALGAEIRGLKNLDDLSEDERTELVAAWRQYHLLLFRGQDITAGEQAGLCRHLGPLLRESYYAPPEPVADAGAADIEYIGMFSNRMGVRGSARLLYHSDLSHTDAPIAGISLYGVEIPEAGTSTFFVNSELAWSTLPGSLREQLANTRVSHSLEVTQPTVDQPARLRDSSAVVQRITYPVPWLNPQNGEPVLYMTEMMTDRLEELPAEVSQSLLEEIFAHLYLPAHQYEHRWQPGDLLIWNNVALQHARADEARNGRRTLRRVVFSTPDWHDTTQTFLDEAMKQGLHDY